MNKRILIIGAGPAGLAAAYKLCKRGMEVHIYESHPQQVGGLSKTIAHKEFSFDIGGHRFYTKSEEVREFWHKIMGDQFLKRKRLSRIFFENKFFNYPLELSDVLLKISPLRSLGFLLSYLKAQIENKLLSHRESHSLEDWLTHHFGKSLYKTFFKSYSEKVWGRPCSQISSDWAAQRINDFNVKEIVFQLVKKGLFLNRPLSPKKLKTLIGEFDYPEKGPGMLWDKVAKEIESMGGKIYLHHRVKEISKPKDNQWQLSFENGEESLIGDHLISTYPMKELLGHMKSLIDRPEYNKWLSEIQYRDFLTIVLMFKKKVTFPDNWIYIHDKNVNVARIQNYKNWSPFMVPSEEYTSYGLEYFCQKGDGLWEKSDDELFSMAIDEIKKIDLPFSEIELEYKVLRIPKAYPVYDHNHRNRLEEIKNYLEKFPTLHLAGRNGMHRYNNQDHSIKTGFLCAENIAADKKLFDPWQVNQDAIYLEK
tara:strand:- start:16682 stop:18118 length:1437 start_codon:yes stop_codon:yes gene_type:complete